MLAYKISRDNKWYQFGPIPYGLSFRTAMVAIWPLKTWQSCGICQFSGCIALFIIYFLLFPDGTVWYKEPLHQITFYGSDIFDECILLYPLLWLTSGSDPFTFGIMLRNTQYTYSCRSFRSFAWSFSYSLHRNNAVAPLLPDISCDNGMAAIWNSYWWHLYKDTKRHCISDRGCPIATFSLFSQE